MGVFGAKSLQPFVVTPEVLCYPFLERFWMQKPGARPTELGPKAWRMTVDVSWPCFRPIKLVPNIPSGFVCVHFLRRVLPDVEGGIGLCGTSGFGWFGE